MFMALTPMDIHNKDSVILQRINEDEVDQFLDEIVDEFENSTRKIWAER